jgi:epoxyqueuosine reductase QueG
MLKEFFKNEGIEYFSVLDYKSCIEISSPIMEREDFSPKSVILFLMPYYTGETENISRYAASLDYHLAIREVGERLRSYLLDKFPSAKMKIFGDHSPIAERHAALISGLGIAGDSGLLINEKYGTYVFIGDMITDIPAELLGKSPLCEIAACPHCGACKRACPTGVLRGESEECLSAITQKKGELTDEEKSLMVKHNTAWGCDLCQVSCPYNKNPEKTPLEFFYRERLSRIDRVTLDSMSKDDFKKRAFAWRGRKTVERNIDILYSGDKK